MRIQEQQENVAKALAGALASMGGAAGELAGSMRMSWGDQDRPQAKWGADGVLEIEAPSGWLEGFKEGPGGKEGQSLAGMLVVKAVERAAQAIKSGQAARGAEILPGMPESSLAQASGDPVAWRARLGQAMGEGIERAKQAWMMQSVAASMRAKLASRRIELPAPDEAAARAFGAWDEREHAKEPTAQSLAIGRALALRACGVGSEPCKTSDERASRRWAQAREMLSKAKSAFELPQLAQEEPAKPSALPSFAKRWDQGGYRWIDGGAMLRVAQSFDDPLEAARWILQNKNPRVEILRQTHPSYLQTPEDAKIWQPLGEAVAWARGVVAGVERELLSQASLPGASAEAPRL